MPLGPGVSTSLCSEGPQQHAALGAHGLGHGEDEPVAFDGGDKRQGNAGVAAGGLDKDSFAGLDLAGLFGVHRSSRSRCGLSRWQTGFWPSSLATTVAGRPADTRFRRTSGVCPINSVTFAAIRAMIFSFFRDRVPDTSWKMRGIAVELSGGKDARAHGRTPGIGALTRTVLATSTHADSLCREPGKWQAGCAHAHPAVGLRRQMLALRIEANVTQTQ